DAVDLPVVQPPAPPTGTRYVTLDQPGSSPGDWSTLRSLTLNSGSGARTVPAGAYSTCISHSKSRFVRGSAGATEPSVYHFESLILISQSELRVVGPVVINLAYGMNANAPMGDPNHPSWLVLNVSSGGFTLNSGSNFYGCVNAP